MRLRLLLLYGGLLLLFKLYLTYVAFTGDYATFTSDAQDYMRIAHNLKTHGIFSSDPHPPLKHDVIRMPIYPLLLALLGGKGTLVLQHLLLLLVVLLLWRRGWRREALILFLSPTVSVFVNQNLTEGLFAPLIALLLTVRVRVWGLLWGLLALLRQATVLLFPPILLVDVWRSKRWSYALLHITLFLTPVVAWTGVNWLKGGAPIFSGVFTTTVAVYLVERFYDITPHIRAYSDIPQMGVWITDLQRVAFGWMLHHPVESLVLWLKETFFTVVKAIPRGYLYPFGPMWPVAYLMFYPYLLYIYRETVRSKALFGISLFYILAVGLPGDPRLRLPVEIMAIMWPVFRRMRGR
ncbi:MAG: hypothetical protein GXO29_05545 [Thermotogae bacterium]|nr:hypothetical protein [Thermotogota bacterium]